MQHDSTDRVIFLSDWDNKIGEGNFYEAIVKKAYENALKGSGQYKFAYEQFGIKQQVLNFINETGNLSLTDKNITLSPGATQSIFLSLKSIERLGRHRALLITPAYFSTYFSLEETNLFINFFHLLDENDYRIDFDLLVQKIEEQFLDVIILTDPVYSSGIDVNVSDYVKLSEICRIYQVALVVDFSLGGLLWKDSSSMLIASQKLNVIKTLPDFVFVDSITKRLSLNGMKFSLLLGSESIIDQVDSISESVYGGLSSIQCELMKKIYTADAIPYLEQRRLDTVQLVSQNWRVLKSLLIDTSFKLSNTDSGYFATLNHKNLNLEDIDSEKLSSCLLKEKGILALTKNKLSYYQKNKFGVRLNLCQETTKLLPAVNQCIGIDYERFHQIRK